MLSACAAVAVAPVASVLLLQPAVSYLCFAVDADGQTSRWLSQRARANLRHSADPASFSSRDGLARLFHFAVRRKSDVGEQRIAAVRRAVLRHWAATAPAAWLVARRCR